MKTIMLSKDNVHKGNLILVNREHPIKDHALLSDVELVPVGSGDGNILLESKTASILLMILDSLKCNDRIVPISGYRSYEEQGEIYSESSLENGDVFTKKYVALPGHSEHQTGLAIDLGKNSAEINFIRPEFPYTGIFGAFRKKALQYGFIERYKGDKEDITGISHEPWHFRYVGYPHSQIIERCNLSLEEYICYIKKFHYGERHFRIYEGSRLIEVFFVYSDTERTTVELPENSNYEISGNNVDGFIITVWR